MVGSLKCDYLRSFSDHFGILYRCFYGSAAARIENGKAVSSQTLRHDSAQFRGKFSPRRINHIERMHYLGSLLKYAVHDFGMRVAQITHTQSSGHVNKYVAVGILYCCAQSFVPDKLEVHPADLSGRLELGGLIPNSLCFRTGQLPSNAGCLCKRQFH